MRTGLIVVGALLLLIGIVWTGQGANLIGGNFMTGQRMRLVIGVITSVAGTGLIGCTLIAP